MRLRISVAMRRVHGTAEKPPANLQGVVDELVEVCAQHRGGRVSVSNVMGSFGRGSFGRLLLVPGLIGISPIGAIPGLPAVMAAIEILVAGQILIGMKHFWIPRTIAKRSIAEARLHRALKAIRPYARMVDRFFGPRLVFLTRGVSFYVLTVLCFLIALVMPIIEIVPLAGIVPNAAIVAFGLAITAHDGVWALLAFLFTGASIYLVVLVV